ncbi:aldo/keto reductase [Wenxinia saemankumensis]|uniref:Aldo/keto reductase n=1 Tax=Wenxinia saemankumensis TaxID=1447782 RepID=A0A1M6A4D4_9RHOB|nr:aldo/keto reductase [Wenxinia saemankumensis]SHI31013.1 Aldo/keto reductase [Wenxinia saemankumensis]
MPVRPIGPAGIPNLGLGTFGLRGDEGARIVAEALRTGYTHIDTARMYENEGAVGRGMRDSGVARDRIFLTTKIPQQDHGAEAFRRATEDSLRTLGTDHVDLLLLHWPSRDVPLSETLPVLDALIDEGKVRFGGISNHPIALVDEARGILSHPIAANQIEMHPFLDQTKLLSHLESVQIPFEAYSPLAQGRVKDDPVLTAIAEAHGTQAGTVALAWILSKPGGIAIPKTATPERLAQNLAAADLTLTADELARIDGLARPDGRLIDPADGPDWD